MLIRLDDLEGPEIRMLLEEHLRSMHEHSPAESVHALDLHGLRQPDITFWTVWNGDELMGCGALKQLDPTHGEVKSMRTAVAHRRTGVGRAVLQHIVSVALARTLASASRPARCRRSRRRAACTRASGSSIARHSATTGSTPTAYS